jgi:hypothetical protein
MIRITLPDSNLSGIVPDVRWIGIMCEEPPFRTYDIFAPRNWPYPRLILEPDAPDGGVVYGPPIILEWVDPATEQPGVCPTNPETQTNAPG